MFQNKINSFLFCFILALTSTYGIAGDGSALKNGDLADINPAEKTIDTQKK